MSWCWSVHKSVPRYLLKTRGGNSVSSVPELANSELFGYQTETPENLHSHKLFYFLLKRNTVKKMLPYPYQLPVNVQITCL